LRQICHTPGVGRKKFNAALFLSVVLAGVLTWEFFRSHEPNYHDKPLSFWLEGYLDGSVDGPRQADEAMKAIGTNAIPTLVNLLHVHDSRLDLTILWLLQKQSLFLFDHVPADQYNQRGIRGFEKLRAYPELVLPALIKCLHDPVAEVRVNAAHSLGTFGIIGNVSRPAVPELTAALNDPDWRVRSWSSWALAQINPKPPTNAPPILTPRHYTPVNADAIPGF
jgi:HEAT repeats